MRKTTVEHEIYSTLRKRVHDGVYASGTRLPNQRELASEFGTSPTTISKALGQLRSAGLIEMVQGKGTKVLSFDERPPNGAVGVFKSGDGVLSHREPAGIYRGIVDELSVRNQHFRFIHGAVFEHYSGHPDELTRDFAGAVFIELSGGADLMASLEERRFPCVVANLEEALEFTSTFVDHGKTTETAVRFLAAMGHRKIAVVTRPVDGLFYAEAVEGFKRGLKSAGLRFSPEYMIVAEGRQELGAYQAVRTFFDKTPSERLPTAFVACRDYMAYGVCVAVREVGLAVGRDISVIGFDNMTWPEERSPLTTFQEPAEEMGRIAAQMVLERLLKGWLPVERREVPAPLILRSSAGPPSDASDQAPTSLRLWPSSPE